jgi:hypothetical protein
MSRCVKPSDCQCNYVDELEPLVENSMVCEDGLLNTRWYVQEDNWHSHQLSAVEIMLDEGEIGWSLDLAGGQARPILHINNEGKFKHRYCKSTD